MRTLAGIGLVAIGLAGLRGDSRLLVRPHARAAESLDEGALADDAATRITLGVTIADIIREHGLPLQLFRDLLSAFAQDVVKARYTNYPELLDYCRRSANPIGRLLLVLYGAATPQNNAWGDAICSSLQLINFWQDVAIDYRKDRIYFPQDEMTHYGITEAQIADATTNDTWRAFLRFQVNRTRQTLHSGAPLGRVLKGRLGLEMRMIIAGGERILRKIETVNYDVFQRRPVLKPHDWLLMLAKSAF